MALDGILKKITENAEEKVAAIEEEGRRKRQEVLSRAKDLAKEIADRISQEAASRAELDRRRSEVSAELEFRKEILKEKQEIMEDCFREALDELVKLPADKYRALIRSMLSKLVSSGEEHVVISPEDKEKIDRKFIDSINDELKGADRKGRLKLDGTSPKIRGGFLLKTEDVEVDCSFGALLGQLREEMQADVAGILFGEKK
jgi:V/A-type H+-transporting ATPase subunit E